METSSKWGFLRETRGKAIKAGIDKDTGLHRTGLEDYLAVIFPEIPEKEWIHDEVISGSKRRIRPDYRCERMRLIIEFDGVQHYTKPDIILKDRINQEFYEGLDYKVIRIPYFIQLTSEVIETMFGVCIDEPMFPANVPSMGIKGHNTPAYCCYAGLMRMAEDFKKYPDQYNVNMSFLESQGEDFLTGYSLLKKAYDSLNSQC